MGEPYPGFSGNAAGATGAALAIASGGLWWTAGWPTLVQQPLCLLPCLHCRSKGQRHCACHALRSAPGGLHAMSEGGRGMVIDILGPVQGCVAVDR